MELYIQYAQTYEQLTREAIEYVETLRRLKRMAPGLKDYDAIIDSTLAEVSKRMEKWENTREFIFRNYSEKH